MAARAIRASGLGLRLLGVWLVLHGVLSVTTFSIPGITLLLALIAIAAGVLLLAGR